MKKSASAKSSTNPNRNQSMTTETQPITSEAVAAWMLARRDECIAISPRGAVQFAAESHNYVSTAKPIFRAYNEHLGHTKECGTAEEAIEELRLMAGAYTPEERATKLREEAAEKLKEADELEAAL